MESHAQELNNKIVGQRVIRKRGTQTSEIDRKAKVNLSEVNRIKISTKKCYQPTRRKVHPKREHSTAYSQESADEQGEEYRETDASQEIETAPNQQINTLIDVNTGAATPLSVRDKKKPKRYGDLTELSSSDGSSDAEQAPKQRKGTSIASYSPTRATHTPASTSPPHSIIPTIPDCRDTPTENLGPTYHANEEDPIQGDVHAFYTQDQFKRCLEPHES